MQPTLEDNAAKLGLSIGVVLLTGTGGQKPSRRGGREATSKYCMGARIDPDGGGIL
jgi:hypothetical protein